MPAVLLMAAVLNKIPCQEETAPGTGVHLVFVRSRSGSKMLAAISLYLFQPFWSCGSMLCWPGKTNHSYSEAA